MKEKFFDVLAPFFDSASADEEKSSSDKEDISDILAALAPLIKQNEDKETDNTDENNNNETEEKEPDLAIEGQKSILQALIKLTNITKALVEEKEEEAVNNIKSSRIKEQVRTIEDDIEYVYDDDSTGLESSLDAPRSSKPKSLIEEIALNSRGPNNLHGNQALFEEFVKLSIERQRWENAARVHDIIQGTLTTTDKALPNTAPLDYEEDRFSEEDLDDIKVNRKGNKPGNKRKHQQSNNSFEDEDNLNLRKEEDRRLFREEGRQGNKHLRTKQNRKFNRPNVFVSEYDEEYYDYEDYPINKPKLKTTTKRPRRRPHPSKKKTTTTTTEEPFYYDEEYYDYSDEELVGDNVEEQIVNEENAPDPKEQENAQTPKEQERNLFTPPSRHSNNRLFPSRFSTDKRKQSPITRSQFNLRERKEEVKDTIEEKRQNFANSLRNDERKFSRPDFRKQTIATTEKVVEIPYEDPVEQEEAKAVFAVREEVEINTPENEQNPQEIRQNPPENRQNQLENTPKPQTQSPLVATQTIKAFVDLQLAERRKNELKSEVRQNSFIPSSTENSRFEVITAVPDRTTSKVEKSTKLETVSELPSRSNTPQALTEADIIHITPKVIIPIKEDNVQVIASSDPINTQNNIQKNVNIATANQRRPTSGNRRLPSRDRLRDLFMKSQDRLHQRTENKNNHEVNELYIFKRHTYIRCQFYQYKLQIFYLLIYNYHYI